ncbi:MAG: aminotransferase class I/II-fold pyridoxal phosphate-dependent enzyme, partial [Actinomycetota bacterium]
MSPRRTLAPRPDLLEVAPYMSPQMPGFEGIVLNTNESPYPPPPGLIETLTKEFASLALNRYPNRDATALIADLATHCEWPADGIWVANGSNEVFLHLLLTFGGPGRKAMTFEPTYSLHSLIPRITSTTAVPVSRTEDFAVDREVAVAAVERERPEIVILCSPNNPTGGVDAHGTVRAIAEATPGIVVVDEAYGEFADPSESMRDLLGEYPNLVITRTFSKAWRLAGARIGYMLAASQVVRELLRVRLPYHLSSITQAIGRAAIRYAPETVDLARSIARERDRLIVGLQSLGVTTFPSRANFVLFEVDDT